MSATDIRITLLRQLAEYHRALDEDEAAAECDRRIKTIDTEGPSKERHGLHHEQVPNHHSDCQLPPTAPPAA